MKKRRKKIGKFQTVSKKNRGGHRSQNSATRTARIEYAEKERIRERWIERKRGYGQRV